MCVNKEYHNNLSNRAENRIDYLPNTGLEHQRCFGQLSPFRVFLLYYVTTVIQLHIFRSAEW